MAERFERAIAAAPSDWHMFQPAWPEGDLEHGPAVGSHPCASAYDAWDDPGGVQTHVASWRSACWPAVTRSGAGAPSDRGRPGVGEARRTTPVDVPYRRLQRPRSPLVLGRFAALAEEIRRFAPDVVHVHEPFTPTHRCGPRWPLACRWWRRSIRVAPDRVSMTCRATAPAACGVARRPRSPSPCGRRGIVRRATDRGRLRDRAQRRVDVVRFASARARRPRPPGGAALRGPVGRAQGFPDRPGGVPAARDDVRRSSAGGRGRRPGPRCGAATCRRGTSASASRCWAACPTSTCHRSCAAGDLYLGRPSVGRASACSWWRRWRQGCLSSPSDIPGYREVVARRCRRAARSATETPRRWPRPLGRVLGDDALAGRLREAGRARAAPFDWTVVVDARITATGVPPAMWVRRRTLATIGAMSPVIWILARGRRRRAARRRLAVQPVGITCAHGSTSGWAGIDVQLRTAL